MSTRSLIGYQLEDKSIRWAYVHFDGYPEAREPLLHNYYNDLEKVKQLVELGEIRVIAKELANCETFENISICGVVPNLEEFLKLKHGSLYKYLFTKGEWYWCRCWSSEDAPDMMEILPYNYKMISIFD